MTSLLFSVLAKVFTTTLQIRGVPGLSGQVFAAGLPDGEWGG
jgi:hypothetical protein